MQLYWTSYNVFLLQNYDDICVDTELIMYLITFAMLADRLAATLGHYHAPCQINNGFY